MSDNIFDQHIRPWGNSLGIVIPDKVFRKTRFRDGADVEITIEDENTITVRRKQ